MKIMVLREKYGNTYINVSTPEQLNKICLKIVKHRYVNNRKQYIYESACPKMPDFSKESIDSLPDSLKSSAKMTWMNYEQNLAGYKEERDMIDMVDKCMATQDGKLAYKILKFRSQNEYEGFDLIDVLEDYFI